jgi:hypothetical protein
MHGLALLERFQIAHGPSVGPDRRCAQGDDHYRSNAVHRHFMVRRWKARGNPGLFHFGDFLSLTPGPSPFSSTKITPANSMATWIATKVERCGVPFPLSKFRIVAFPTFDESASWC